MLWVKYLVAGIVGCAFGVLCTRGYFKKKYHEDAKRRIALELSNRIFQSPSMDVLEEEAEEKEREENSGISTNESYIQSTMTLNQYHDYTQYYDCDIVDDHPSEESYLEDVGEQMTEDRKNSQGPRIMAWEEIGSRPEFEDLALFWHVDEGWLETEDGERVDDPSSMVGNCLIEPTEECPSGFLTSSRQSINIINERRGETYEVTKVRGRSYM